MSRPKTFFTESDFSSVATKKRDLREVRILIEALKTKNQHGVLASRRVRLTKIMETSNLII